jgi:hypothetical protein
MAKVNMSALNEYGPRTVFIPLNPYRPDCEAGWTVTLADDEEVCPSCRAHPCVDEWHSSWCRTCNENGYIKTTPEEFDNEQ